MKTQYYNRFEFDQAFSIAKTDPLESRYRFEEYFKKYPKDYSGYCYYARVLITLNDYEEAEKILEYAEIMSSRDGTFLKEDSKVYKFKEVLAITKLRLLSYQGKYEELYDFYKMHEKLLENTDRKNFRVVPFFAKAKLGKLEVDREGLKSYLYRQIARYDEDEFREHIKRHLQDCEESVDNASFFVSGFPIDLVIDEVRKYIPSDKGMGLGFTSRIYIFKYYECGRNDNRLTDYFKVACIEGTSDIITMCPTIEGKNLPYVDLNYLAKEEKPKVKKLSQIEKFNQRYRRN